VTLGAIGNRGKQAKRLRVAEDEVVVVDVPYDEDIGVDLPQVNF
jgi:hypothetical protein